MYKWKVFVRTGWYGSKNQPPDNEAQKPWRRMSKVWDPMICCLNFIDTNSLLHAFFQHFSVLSLIDLKSKSLRKTLVSSSFFHYFIVRASKSQSFILFTTFSPWDSNSVQLSRKNSQNWKSRCYTKSSSKKYWSIQHLFC